MTTSLQLKGVGAETLRALYDNHPDWASGEPGVLQVAWPDEDRRMLGYRMAALDQDPTSAPYLLHLALDEDGALLGRIGCHAGPDAAGEVEIGYYVRPEHRGRGIAGQVVDLFLDWLREQGVQSVRASVGPANAASLAILHRRGFRETGCQIDDEDGEELIFTLPL